MVTSDWSIFFILKFQGIWLMVVARCRDCYGFPWIFVCFGCVSLWTCFCIFLFSFLFLLIIFAIVLLSRSCSISECRSSVYSKCVMLGASECFVHLTGKQGHMWAHIRACSYVSSYTNINEPHVRIWLFVYDHIRTVYDHRA